MTLSILLKKTNPTPTYRVFRQLFLQEQISKYLVTVLRQFVLLSLAAMVLEREYHRVVRSHERGIPQSVDDIFEENVGTHCHAVSDDWLFVFSFAIPTVELYASGIKRNM